MPLLATTPAAGPASLIDPGVPSGGSSAALSGATAAAFAINPVLGGALAIGGALFGARSARRARRARRAANALAARLELIREHRDIVNRLRQTRIAAAQIAATAANQGAGTATPVQGAQGALFSDFSAEVGLMQEAGAINRQRIRLGAAAERAEQRSSAGFSLANLGLGIALS